MQAFFPPFTSNLFHGPGLLGIALRKEHLKKKKLNREFANQFVISGYV